MAMADRTVTDSSPGRAITSAHSSRQSELAERLLERCNFGAVALTPGVPTALAVSGGADSLALLVLAARAGLDIVAVHVDHGLRPGSDQEAAVVAAAAAAYGGAFEARRVLVPPGPDLEARARQARYQALPSAVLTGHTMDDQAETVILAMLRGAALDGLSGMRLSKGAASAARPVRPVRPVRPLLRLRRWETSALCASEGLVPLDDPDNHDPRFRRNRVRAELLPLLSDVAGRDLVPVLARQADLLAEDADLLEVLSERLDPTDARQLVGEPVSLARRAVRRWLRSGAGLGDAEQHPPSAAEVGRVLAVARGEVRACELAGGRRVERRSGRLRVMGQ